MGSVFLLVLPHEGHGKAHGLAQGDRIVGAGGGTATQWARPFPPHEVSNARLFQNTRFSRTFLCSAPLFSSEKAGRPFFVPRGGSSCGWVCQGGWGEGVRAPRGGGRRGRLRRLSAEAQLSKRRFFSTSRALSCPLSYLGAPLGAATATRPPLAGGGRRGGHRRGAGVGQVAAGDRGSHGDERGAEERIGLSLFARQTIMEATDKKGASACLSLSLSLPPSRPAPSLPTPPPPSTKERKEGLTQYHTRTHTHTPHGDANPRARACFRFFFNPPTHTLISFISHHALPRRDDRHPARRYGRHAHRAPAPRASPARPGRSIE